MVRKEILKEIIKDFQSGVLPDSKSRDLSIPIDSGKVITLSGVRRSGKTYLLYETIKSLSHNKISIEQVLYINFEDERLALKQDELDLILQAYRELYPDNHLSECYFFFDEIQNVTGWERFIRRVYDTITTNIFVTGSNSRLLSSEIATSLRGRTITYEVFPLSYKEYLRFHGVEPDIGQSKGKAKAINLFEKFLLEGGFPEILTVESVQLKNRILQEYFDVMLYRDIAERFNITNMPVLKCFLKRLFENVTKPVSINNIYNELKSQGYKTGKDSLYEYLDAAEAVYLFLAVRKYNVSVLKRELSERKLYSVDNGLLNAITFKFSKDYGKLLENLIFMELSKNTNTVFFYKNSKECDFIVAKDQDISMVVQSAYSIADYKTRKREVEGLISACKRLSVQTGRIITFSEEDNFSEQNIDIQVIPAYKFLLQ